jgi:hypothetical protein
MGGITGSSKKTNQTISYNTDNSQDNRQTDNKVAAAEGANVFSAGYGTITQGNTTTTLGANSVLNQTSDRAFDTVDRAVASSVFGLESAAAVIGNLAQNNADALHEASQIAGGKMKELTKYLPYIIGGAVVITLAYLYIRKGK